MLTKRRRGRPPRAGTRAYCRIEFTLTPAELRRVRRLAQANRCKVADIVRLGLLTLAADLDEGCLPPVVLGHHVGPIISSR